MSRRNKAGNGRIGNTGSGMETWKLAAIAGLFIVLAVVGGFSLELLPPPTAQAEIDLGFDAGSAPPAVSEGRG